MFAILEASSRFSALEHRDAGEPLRGKRRRKKKKEIGRMSP